MLVSHGHPAAALDDDEPRRVRVRVRLDLRVPSERELGDEPSRVAVDHLALEADGARRTLRSPVADAETDDLHRVLDSVALSFQRRRRRFDGETRIGREPRARAAFGRIVDSGWANFDWVK